MSNNGTTVGPMPEADVKRGIDSGHLKPGMHIRDADGGQWMSIEQSPFGSRFFGVANHQPDPVVTRARVWLLASVLGAGAFLLYLKSSWDEHQEKERVAYEMRLHDAAEAAARAEAEAKAESAARDRAALARRAQSPDTGPQLRQAFAMSIGERMNETEGAPFAAGENLTTLVPSADIAKCRLWAPMWAKDVAIELRAVGFTELACGFQRWPL